MGIKILRKPARLSQIAKALLVFFILVTPNVGHAAPGQHSAGASFGQILLLGDYAKYFDNGLGFGLSYEYEASAIFGVTARFHYSSHRGVSTTASDTSSTNTLSIMGFTPNLRANIAFLDRLTVYSILGFGVFLVSQHRQPQQGSATTFGFNLGAGFDLPLFAHFKFGTLVSFHNIFDRTDPASATSTLPALNMGGTFMSLMINASYIF